MKAVVLDEERRLELREVPDPQPAERQTLVEVRAAGVNYADVLIREGRYPRRRRSRSCPARRSQA